MGCPDNAFKKGCNSERGSSPEGEKNPKKEEKQRAFCPLALEVRGKSTAVRAQETIPFRGAQGGREKRRRKDVVGGSRPCPSTNFNNHDLIREMESTGIFQGRERREDSPFRSTIKYGQGGKKEQKK